LHSVLLQLGRAIRLLLVKCGSKGNLQSKIKIIPDIITFLDISVQNVLPAVVYLKAED
jgi:hypothetical protein